MRAGNLDKINTKRQTSKGRRDKKRSTKSKIK